MEAPSGGPFDVLEGGQFLDAGRADVHDQCPCCDWLQDSLDDQPDALLPIR